MISYEEEIPLSSEEIKELSKYCGFMPPKAYVDFVCKHGVGLLNQSVCLGSNPKFKIDAFCHEREIFIGIGGYENKYPFASDLDAGVYSFNEHAQILFNPYGTEEYIEINLSFEEFLSQLTVKEQS